MTDLLALFRAEGIAVREAGDWRSRVRPGVFKPEGIVVHHTGSKGQGDDGLSILIDGRADLNGPLCNASPRDDGTLVLISAGRANHAGAGSSEVLDRVRHDLAPRGLASTLGLVDDTTGNGWFYGLEVDNSGDPNDPYPPTQYETTVRACAALCRHHGWTANRVILHSEWTRRKRDWSLSGSGLRGNVAAYLRRTAEPHEGDAVTDDEIEKVAQRVFALLKPYVATHEDMKTLLRGTADGRHPANLTAIAEKVGVKL